MSDETGGQIPGVRRMCPTCMLPGPYNGGKDQQWEYSPERMLEAALGWISVWRWTLRGQAQTPPAAPEPTVQDIAAVRKARQEEQARKDAEAAAVWQAWKAQQAAGAGQAKPQASTAAEPEPDEYEDDLPF